MLRYFNAKYVVLNPGTVLATFGITVVRYNKLQFGRERASQHTCNSCFTAVYGWR